MAAVPKKHDDEPTGEVQGDVYADWIHARTQEKIWNARKGELEAKLRGQMGDATGGTVNGRLVVTYRYKDTYAKGALVRDNPALTQHYMRTRTVEELDMEAFALVHPDIAKRYQVREFRVAGSLEEEKDAS